MPGCLKDDVVDMGGSGIPAATDEISMLTNGVLLLRRDGIGGREVALAAGGCVNKAVIGGMMKSQA